MSHPNFDLVVLDLDGTILDKKLPGGIAQEVRATIAAVQEAGVPVTIATGRTFDDVRRLIGDLPIRLPIVTAQGALVANLNSGEIHYRRHMPLALARQVAAWLDNEPHVAFFYFSDERGDTQIVQNRMEWSPEEYDHLFGVNRRVEPRLSPLLSAESADSPMKFIVVNDVHGPLDLAQALRQRFEPGLHISRTHDLLVEGTDARVDKGSGLQQLLDILGISPERVLAIGDNDNDIPVLRLAGTSIVMGQARSAVRAEADWIAPPIEEHGAAVAMRRFILE